MGRRGRRRKQLLDDQKETTGCYKLKQQALGRILRRILFWKSLSTCHKRDHAEPSWTGTRLILEACVSLSQFYEVTAEATSSISGPYMSKEHQ